MLLIYFKIYFVDQKTNKTLAFLYYVQTLPLYLSRTIRKEFISEPQLNSWSKECSTIRYMARRLETENRMPKLGDLF